MTNNKNITMEDINKNLHATIKLNLLSPKNEIVAWAVFDNRTLTESNVPSYSSYAELDMNSSSINSAHIELMDSIEEDIKQLIDESIHSVDFSTMDSTYKSINKILDIFLPKKYKELTSLSFKENSFFKDAPIWWAAIVIAYREMALFAFVNDNFYLAIYLNEFCKECQLQMVFKNLAFIKDYQKKLSAMNKKASDARWQPHREDKRKRKMQYLKIMKEQGFSTYTDAATYIKQNIETGKKPSFPTVCRLLSEADKGIFS
ncbi:hypothetical protein [Psychrobacter immobilis]|uniref:hypothetical protein n=1 Tax=Psychrobacter immobilis TaxID=498 RepID=UPI001918D073|nr:hypothetical protein [Psychrobacter immobilis]